MIRIPPESNQFSHTSHPFKKFSAIFVDNFLNNPVHGQTHIYIYKHQRPLIAPPHCYSIDSIPAIYNHTSRVEPGMFLVRVWSMFSRRKTPPGVHTQRQSRMQVIFFARPARRVRRRARQRPPISPFSTTTQLVDGSDVAHLRGAINAFVVQTRILCDAGRDYMVFTSMRQLCGRTR